MDQLLSSIPNVAIFICIALFVFILIREIICWYFKINERLETSKLMLIELKKLNNKEPTL